MSDQKLSADALRQELDRLRDASRTRARRLQLTGSLIVSLGVLLFLTLAVVAALALWQSLQAPVYVAVLLGVLAAAIQRVLGLAMRHGRFRRPARQRSLWIIMMLLSGTALILLAG